MIGRRSLLAAATVSVVLPAVAQTRPALIAVVSEAQDNGAWVIRTISARLRELGLRDDRDIVFIATTPWRAAEVVALGPALFVTTGPQAIRAALAAMPDKPVLALTGELVASGFAQSLARPGGRVTGVSFNSEDLNAKRLELLLELEPRPAQVTVLADASIPVYGLREMEATASALGIRLDLTSVKGSDDIDAAIDKALASATRGINVLASPMLNANRLRIIARAQAERLPAIFQWPETATEGGLMAYGPSLGQLYRSLGTMAARILRGMNVGDIPIERPTQFQLAINLRTATALNLTVPTQLLARADEVIE